MDQLTLQLLRNVQSSNKISRLEVEQLLDQVRADKSATNAQVLLILQCCGSILSDESKETRMALVHNILESYEASNISLNISHYNALLRVYWENEHRFSATDFLADLESKGLLPNRVTYQKLLLCCCLNGEIKVANNIFAAMKEKGFGISQYIFDMLVITNSQADELEAAADMLEETIRANKKLSDLAFYSLLCAYARKGDIEYMCQTLETCKKNNIIMKEEGFIMILQSLADSGHGKHIKRVEEQMHQYGYVLDDLSRIFSLISITKQFESFDRAVIAEDDNITECQGLAKSFNDMMFDAGSSTENGQKRMLIMLKSFINEGLTISKRLGEKLSDLYAESSDMKFKSLLGRLNENKSGAMNEHDGTAHKTTAGKHLSVPELEEFILEMESMDLNVNTLKLQLIRSVIRSNDQEKLVALLQRLEDENFEIPPDIYEEAVEMYVTSGKTKYAEELLKRIRIKNPTFTLSCVVLLRVAKYLLDNNQFVDTLQFIQENIPHSDLCKHDQSELESVYIHAYWEFLIALMDKCNDNQINTQFLFVFIVDLLKELLIRIDVVEEKEILLAQCEKESKVDPVEELKHVKKDVIIPGSPTTATVSDNEKTKPTENLIIESETQNELNLNTLISKINRIRFELAEDQVAEPEMQNKWRPKIDNGNLKEQSNLLQAMLSLNDLSSATKLVLDILEEKLIPEATDFDDFLEAAAVNGHIDTFNRIGALLPASVKYTVNFDLLYRWADISSGNVRKYLYRQLRLSRKLTSKEEATKSIEGFCIVGSCWGLKQRPEVDGLFKEVAENYAIWGVLKPYEVLWQHYFIIGESQKAYDIWNNNIAHTNRIDIEEILHEANKTYHAPLCRRLIRFWCKYNCAMDINGVYDSLIDILLAQKDPSSALRLMKYVKKESVALDGWTQMWLQSNVEFQGLDFPYFPINRNHLILSK